MPAWQTSGTGESSARAQAWDSDPAPRKTFEAHPALPVRARHLWLPVLPHTAPTWRFKRPLSSAVLSSEPLGHIDYNGSCAPGSGSTTMSRSGGVGPNAGRPATSRRPSGEWDTYQRSITNASEGKSSIPS
jgi:hypothetical protein